MRILGYNAFIEGQTVLLHPLLSSKTLLAVYVDGVGMDKILSSGIPAGKQVKFTGATINFGTPLSLGIYVLILYQ